MKNTLIIMPILIILNLITGCKKFVEVDGPTTSVNSKNIFNTDATAIGAVTALYVNLSKGFFISPGELTSLSCIAGLSADELKYYSSAGDATLSAYYRNSLTSLNVGGGTDYWETSFQRMYIVNLALEELEKSTHLTPEVKNQLLGEVKFMRAFYYFYLVNLYGSIPLVLTSDYATNALIPKSPMLQVYKQIVADLKEAQVLLSDHYLKNDCITPYPAMFEERVRPTKWAATALLARTYLFMKDWASAEAESTVLLTNTDMLKLVSLDQVFLKNSSEAIWQLQPVSNGLNTSDANTFVLPQEGPSSSNPVFLSEDLINDFEQQDQRKALWTNSVHVNGNTFYYPSKYKVIFSIGAPVTEYTTVMRLAEQYLIRAEARAEQNNLIGSIADVDVIRKRANLALIENLNPDVSKEELIEVILEQKRLEFFTEWGHRWLDLKRSGNIDRIMNAVMPKKGNGLSWESHQQNYPISLNELKANPNLVQTDGY